mgnify:FL=1|tara:strand:- start:44 stop:619 length:576 start_codon:yes stop_codon:yes gene_type:complete
MKKIGLTGGIGVGKTFVAEVFQKLNIPVFNADIEAKLCLVNNFDLINSVKNEFGEKIYLHGIFQKEVLADIVFNNTDALKKLNSLVHPFVRESFTLWCKEQENKILIKEAAILFESKSNLDLDSIICVSAPYNLRIKRLQKRDGASLEDIKKRIANQMSQEKKERLSDYIIYNDEKQLILPQILNIIKEME